MKPVEIMKDIYTALQTDPTVIAYLGGASSEWNPNVMIEVGYRRATGLPIVLLRDNLEGSTLNQIPFDLQGLRQVFLLPEYR